jgi:hypothetical protein
MKLADIGPIKLKIRDTTKYTRMNLDQVKRAKCFQIATVLVCHSSSVMDDRSSAGKGKGWVSGLV